MKWLGKGLDAVAQAVLDTTLFVLGVCWIALLLAVLGGLAAVWLVVSLALFLLDRAVRLVVFAVAVVWLVLECLVGCAADTWREVRR